MPPFDLSQLPEGRILPDGWEYKITNYGNGMNRVYFVNTRTGKSTFHHPHLGMLDPPWVLTYEQGPDKGREYYYNCDTREKTRHDPRFMTETIKAQVKNVRKDMREAVSIMKSDPKIKLSDQQRASIENYDLSDQYTVVHTIDPGDGSIGAMNGGVFVVRSKGVGNRLSVLKRFKTDGRSFQMAQGEIRLLQKLMHPSFTAFVKAYIVQNPPSAGLYVEFCDRSSLDSLIRKFTQRNAIVPEPFIWHVFIGLCDGLNYLLTGCLEKGHKPSNWTPLLHRDIKPDNILLRSRFTLGSNKYFYVVLSDFGLACEEFNDPYQQSRSLLGTLSFWAPELCAPFGKPRPSTYPGNYKHSRYTDVWALGTAVFNVAICRNGGAHMQFPPWGVPWNDWMGRRESLNDPLDIKRFTKNYTEQLREAILLATRRDPKQRPDAATLLPKLKSLAQASGFDFHPESDQKYVLPDWATRIHEYNAK